MDHDTVENRLPSPADRRALLAAAAAGQDWALSRLYAEHHVPLVRYLAACAGEDEERFAARAWLAASARFSELPESGYGIRPWLLRIAREQVRRDRRRLRSADHAIDRRLARLDLRAWGSGPFSADTLAGDAATERVRAALPVEQAEVVVLAVVARCTVAEIARVTNRTPEQVQAMQSEAGDTLDRSFGAAELYRQLERASRTVPGEPPDALIAAMADTARRTHQGVRGSIAVAAKVAVVGVVLIGSATGAAASGLLPEPAQHTIATIASYAGLDLPSPDEEPAVVVPAGEPILGPDDGAPVVPAEERVIEPGGPEPVDDPAPAQPPSGTDADVPGAHVSDVARETSSTGADKGRQIADTARDERGERPPAPVEPAGPPESAGETPKPDATAAGPRGGGSDDPPSPPPGSGRADRGRAP